MAMIKGIKLVTICIVKISETYYFESSILDLPQGNDLQLLICCHSFLEVALRNLAFCNFVTSLLQHSSWNTT